MIIYPSDQNKDTRKGRKEFDFNKKKYLSLWSEPNFIGGKEKGRKKNKKTKIKKERKSFFSLTSPTKNFPLFVFWGGFFFYKKSKALKKIEC